MPFTQTELIEKLNHQRDDLFNTLAALTDGTSPWEEQIGKVAIVEQWTAKDIVGHIAYWEQVILDHIRESLTEGKPRPLSPKDPEEKINARESKKRKGWKWTRVRAEFEHTRGALIERVARLSEMELGFIVPNPWWNSQDEFYSIGEMIQEDALDHSAEHIAQIKLVVQP